MKKNLLKKLVNSDVPYLEAAPGTATTNIFEDIAKELNLKYVDLRLSQIGEEEVLGFPVVSNDKLSFHYAMPSWLLYSINYIKKIYIFFKKR